MSHRIQYVEPEAPVRQRRPRVKDEAHLAFIRTLPCVICGKRPVDPAHLRMAKPMLGKRCVGVAEKPSDKWVTPLCREHHDMQHRNAEIRFWRHAGIDPFVLCLALWAASGDIETAEIIIAKQRQKGG